MSGPHRCPRGHSEVSSTSGFAGKVNGRLGKMHSFLRLLNHSGANARLLCALILGALGLALCVPTFAQQATCVEVHCPDGKLVACPNSNPSLAEERAACGMSTQTDSALTNNPLANSLSAQSYLLGQALGNALAKRLFGNSQPAVTAPPTVNASAEREHQIELDRQDQIEAARLAKFKNELQQLSLTMEGPKLPDESILFHDTSNCFFSSDCSSRAIELHPVNISSAQRRFSDAFDQFRISVCLSKMAATAKSPDDAKYLSDEAAKAMNGSTVDVDVSGCDPAPPAEKALTPQQTALLKNLLDSTNRQMDELEKLQEQKVKLEQEKAKLKQEFEAKQHALDQLKQQQPAPVAGQSANGTAPPPQSQSALGDAEQALQAAQQALNDAQKNEGQIDNEMKQIGDKLKANQSCFDQVQGGSNAAQSADPCN